ncbi:hypothetical protein KM043_007359 [Ampulex compressa]|nr:hypothetical protein KM043_007359 [Ampulex compressa]
MVEARRGEALVKRTPRKRGIRHEQRALAMAVAILASTASKTGAAYGSPLPEANAEPEPFAPLARSVVRLLKAMSRGLHRLSQRPATQIGMEMVNER